MHMTIAKFVVAVPTVIMLAFTAVPAGAQDHGTHGAAVEQSAESPAAAAYKTAMDKMHEAMSAIESSGDADIDFARGMIPHHQAAIDMAKIVLEHGKDPKIRKLAEDIITAQESEIKQLEEWLEKHAKM
jgi:uncharacterized protein (DUF305 family)